MKLEKIKLVLGSFDSLDSFLFDLKISGNQENPLPKGVYSIFLSDTDVMSTHCCFNLFKSYQNQKNMIQIDEFELNPESDDDAFVRTNIFMEPAQVNSFMKEVEMSIRVVLFRKSKRMGRDRNLFITQSDEFNLIRGSEIMKALTINHMSGLKSICGRLNFEDLLDVADAKTGNTLISNLIDILTENDLAFYESLCMKCVNINKPNNNGQTLIQKLSTKFKASKDEKVKNLYLEASVIAIANGAILDESSRKIMFPDGSERLKSVVKHGISNVSSGIPIVGHIKGLYHYSLGQNEKGDDCMIESSKMLVTTGLSIGVGLVVGPLVIFVPFFETIRRFLLQLECQLHHLLVMI